MLKTLVVTAAGAPRPELISFLRSIPGVELLEPPDGGFPLYLTEIPDLVVLDNTVTGSGCRELLAEVSSRIPGACCVALVSSSRQMVEALTSGADRVLLGGFSAAEFLQTLEEVLE